LLVIIGKYGDDVLAKAVSNPATRKAITTVIGNSLSEGAEEGTQEVIDVILRNAILGEDNEIDWGNVAYSAGLGALTGGAFAVPGGVNTLVNRDSNINTDPNTLVNYDPGIDTIPNEATATQNAEPVSVTEVELNKQKSTDNEKKIVKRDMSNADDITMQVIKNQYEKSTDNSLVGFIKSVRNTAKNSWMRFRLKSVSDSSAEDIEKLTGIDVHGYNTEIGGSAIEHIDKRHGANGKADSSMADVNDIARMQYVIDNYDDIELSNKHNNEFKNSDGTPSQIVQMKKRVNGDYYVIEAVPDSSKKTVHIISAYKTGIKKEERQVANAALKSAPSAYGRTELGLSSNNSIPLNAENINTSEEISKNNLDTMEMADGNISISINPEEEKSGLTKKAESYLHRNTNALLNDFLEITETDKYAYARTLKRDINTFAEASVKNGEVDRAEAEKLFDTIYWEDLKVNTDVYDKYRPLAEQIKNTKLYGGGLGSLEGEYRRNYFNKVRLVTDPSTTKIDSYYK